MPTPLPPPPSPPIFSDIRFSQYSDIQKRMGKALYDEYMTALYEGAEIYPNYVKWERLDNITKIIWDKNNSQCYEDYYRMKLFRLVLGIGSGIVLIGMMFFILWIIAVVDIFSH